MVKSPLPRSSALRRGREKTVGASLDGVCVKVAEGVFGKKGSLPIRLRRVFALRCNEGAIAPKPGWYHDIFVPRNAFVPWDFYSVNA